MSTLYEVLDLPDSELVAYVFGAWLNSPDARRWTLDDVLDQDEEDDRADRARAHFASWFEEYLLGLGDPEERFADHAGAYHFFRFFAQIDPLKDDFADMIFDDLRGSL